VFKNKVNLLFPFALSRFVARSVPMDEKSAAEGITKAAEGFEVGQLDTVLEEESEEEGESSDNNEDAGRQTQPHAVLQMSTNVHKRHTRAKDSVPTPQQQLVTEGAQLAAGTACSAHTGSQVPGAAKQPTEEQGATALIERSIVSTAGAEAGSKPPIVDVTHPSNAFAWLRLKELMSEMGMHFQLRMQMYLAVAVLLVLLMDIGAVSRVFGSGTLKELGQNAETDIIVAQAIVHSIIMLALVVLCMLLRAFTDSQASNQAEALMHAGVEVDEVARELQLALQQRAAGRMKHLWAQGSHGPTSASGHSSDGSIALQDFTPSSYAAASASASGAPLMPPRWGCPPPHTGGGITSKTVHTTLPAALWRRANTTWEVPCKSYRQVSWWLCWTAFARSCQRWPL